MSKDPTQPGESAGLQRPEPSGDDIVIETAETDDPPLPPSRKALGKRPEGQIFVTPRRLEEGSRAPSRASSRQPQQFLPGQQAAWIAAVNGIDLQRLTPDPAAMLDHALGDVRTLLAAEGESDAQSAAFWRVLKKTTLYRDVWPTPAFQALLRDLMSGEDVDATPVLEDMRDSLAALKQVIR